MQNAALLLLGMMHLKNVKLIENHVSNKLIRKREKHNKPVYRWHSLALTGKGYDSTRLLFSPGRRSNDDRNAFHLCRGHWRTYGENEHGLLFGKYAGTYWIPAHARGAREEGTVDKSYAIPAERMQGLNKEKEQGYGT